MNKRIIIPLVESGCKLPMIIFELGGEKQIALVDTGSESTLFAQGIPANEDFVLEGTNYVMSLVGLSGETSQKRIIGATAKLYVCDDSYNIQKVTVEGIVTDLSCVAEGISSRVGNHLKVAAVIGSDFLTEHSAVIDYKMKKLHLEY